jgi:hypothetical protein
MDADRVGAMVVVAALVVVVGAAVVAVAATRNPLISLRHKSTVVE